MVLAVIVCAIALAIPFLPSVDPINSLGLPTPKKVKDRQLLGVQPSGKAAGFDPAMRKSESCYPCQFTYYGAIIQLVRTPACHAGGRGFDTHSSRQQEFSLGIEQRIPNPHAVVRIHQSLPICLSWIDG